jgi:hypothetical protein
MGRNYLPLNFYFNNAGRSEPASFDDLARTELAQVLCGGMCVAHLCLKLFSLQTAVAIKVMHLQEIFTHIKWRGA